MSDLSNQFVIDDDNYQSVIGPVEVDGNRMGRGLVERDLEKYPQGCFASIPAYSLDDMPLIPRDEWSERIEEMERTKTRLSDLRMMCGPNGKHIPALDQNGQGYCWSYSTGGCMQLLRAKAGMPYVPLSPHSVACKIKNFRDQGAWGCLSLDYVIKHGMASQADWPAKSMSRSHDTPSTWEEARKYRPTEAWVDLQPAVYDRDMTFDQVMTCLLNRIPVIADFYWWGHSVCLMDPVEAERRRSLLDPRRWGVLDLNSWTDKWGNLGTSVLVGNKAVPDGGAAPRAMIGG